MLAFPLAKKKLTLRHVRIF